MKRVLPLFIMFLMTSCFGSQQKDGPKITTVPPAKLQSLGIPLSAYVIVSTEPGKQYPLTLDSDTNSFKGDIKVEEGVVFDLTVVYTAIDAVTGQTTQIAHYVRKGVTAAGETTRVSYAGDENSWQTLFDLDPGKPNDLNLDGDSYNNFVEIGYGSDTSSSESLPEGASAGASRKDPLFKNADVGLPEPGSDVTAALRGVEEMTIEALTPFDVEKIELISPTYGIELLSTDEEIKKNKKIELRVNTTRFVTGPEIGEMSLIVRVTDEFGLERETTFHFSVFNSNDDLPPTELQLGLIPDQVIRDSTTFAWEMDDPSGIDPNTVLVDFTIQDGSFTVTVPVVDENESEKRFLANISLDFSPFPDGLYTLSFLAKDLKENIYSKTVNVRVANTSPVAPFKAVAEVLVNGVETSDPIDETETNIRLNGSGSQGPYPGEARSYHWNCSDRENNDFTMSTSGETAILFSIPNVTRAQGTRNITCTLTFREGGEPRIFTSETDVVISLRFVNEPPSAPVVTFSPQTGTVPQPSNFVISWSSTDSDQDGLEYTVKIAPVGEAEPVVTCTRTSLESISGGATDLATNGCTLSSDRVGYGELLNPFTLGARTDYSVRVTVHDPDTFVSSSPVIGTIRDTDLVGWWRFDEGLGQVIFDRGKGEHNGNLMNFSGGNSQWVSGVRGMALQFDGVDDYVVVEPTSDLEPGTADFSIEVWVDVDSIVGNGPVLFHKGPTAVFNCQEENEHWDLVLRGDGEKPLQYVACDDTDGLVSSTSETVPLEGWHHVAVVHRLTQNPGTVHYYIDGERVKTEYVNQDSLNDATYSNTKLFIGSGFGTTNFFDGLMDEVAIYKRALTIDEIRRSCRRNDPTGSTCPDTKKPVILMPTPGLVLPPTRAYWSWRGERGVDGQELHSNLSYELAHQTYVSSLGQWTQETELGEMATDYYVYPSSEIGADSTYRMIISTTDQSQQYSSTRTFTTDNSIVTWLDLNDGSGSTATDLVGSNDGLLMNGLDNFGWVGGLLDDNGSLKFDGVDNYLDIPNSNSWDFLETAYSITAWVNPELERFLDFGTDFWRDEVVLLGKGRATFNLGMTLRASLDEDITLNFYTGNAGPGTHSCHATNSSGGDGNWHFIGGTYASSPRVRGCYVDEVKGGGATTRVFTDPDDTLKIGWDGDPNDLYFPGLIDEVVIYDRALGSVEMCSLYLAFCHSTSTGLDCDASCVLDESL
jgi:hypothetical protein